MDILQQLRQRNQRERDGFQEIYKAYQNETNTIKIQQDTTVTWKNSTKVIIIEDCLYDDIIESHKVNN